MMYLVKNVLRVELWLKLRLFMITSSRTLQLKRWSLLDKSLSITMNEVYCLRVNSQRLGLPAQLTANLKTAFYLISSQPRHSGLVFVLGITLSRGFQKQGKLVLRSIIIIVHPPLSATSKMHLFSKHVSMYIFRLFLYFLFLIWVTSLTYPNLIHSFYNSCK